MTIDDLGLRDCLQNQTKTLTAAERLQMIAAWLDPHGASRLGCHFHDTRAMAVANYSADKQLVAACCE